MATILSDPEMNAMRASTKYEPVVETAEVQPDTETDTSQDNEAEPEAEDATIEAAGFLRRPKKPIVGRPVPEYTGRPVPEYIGRPVPNPVKGRPAPGPTPYPMPKPIPEPSHPIFIPGGTTLDNVETHMLCNDWFVQNVRELVEEYKRMRLDNMQLVKEVAALNRKVGDLEFKLDNVTRERDQAQEDYDNELLEHDKTKRNLRAVTQQLSELRIRYDSVLAQLKRHKILLGEAYREISQLKVEVINKTERIADLQEKLRISNAAEDAANEKVTELQRCIYELERAKTNIERSKDRAEEAARESDDRVKELQKQASGLQATIRELRRRLRNSGRVGIYEAEADVDADFTAVEGLSSRAIDDPLFEALSKQNAQDPLFEALSKETAQDPPVEELSQNGKSEEVTSSPANEE